MSTQSTNPPVQEFEENSDTCRHRLKSMDGRVTEWASYRSWTYLDGYVGYTAYWTDREGVMPAEEFARKFGVN